VPKLVRQLLVFISTPLHWCKFLQRHLLLLANAGSYRGRPEMICCSSEMAERDRQCRAQLRLSLVTPLRTSSQRHRQNALDRVAPVSTAAPAQADWRCRRASLVRGIPCRHAAATTGLGAAARLEQHLLPLPLHCVVDRGRRLLGPAGKGARPRNSCATPTPISRWSSRLCANTGYRPATPESANYNPRLYWTRAGPTWTCTADPSLKKNQKKKVG
jgi:hypothetical protein